MTYHRPILILMQLHSLLCLSEALDDDWDYQHQYLWPALCQTGTAQSPIDLPQGYTVDKFFDNPLEFINKSESTEMHFSIRYNTIVAFPNERKYTLKGGPLDKEYTLYYISVHHFSEHSINGDHKPLEIQLKFFSSNQRANEDVVVCVWAVSLSIIMDNYKMNMLAQAMHELNVEGDDKKIYLNLQLLLPESLDLFYMYSGSMNHPNCTEDVTYIVMADYLRISEENLDKMAHIEKNLNWFNARDIQKTNDRPILYIYALGFRRSNVFSLNIFAFLLVTKFGA